MTDTVSRLGSLSPKDAIRALGLLYDLAPLAAWEGGVKPPVARIEKICQRVREEAPEEAQPLVDGLFATDDLDARGELARYVLGQYAADAALTPYVQRAIDLAAKPDMAGDPVTLTAIVAFMVLASPEFKTKHITYTGGVVATIRALHIDKIAEQLPAIIKAIPEAILDRFVKFLPATDP